ncbi:hypothetical protein VP01_199g3 [Puccinia sorghi]|uniref:Uncharacterized protein n=1 Tax=Puccinia sorghi TaxID=27349 RepID=A0A0L6VBB9_9BASI|nr:hypothetical protein VP01_199g3 [Puccinia sorghi]
MHTWHVSVPLEHHDRKLILCEIYSAFGLIMGPVNEISFICGGSPPCGSLTRKCLRGECIQSITTSNKRKEIRPYLEKQILVKVQKEGKRKETTEKDKEKCFGKISVNRGRGMDQEDEGSFEQRSSLPKKNMLHVAWLSDDGFLEIMDPMRGDASNLSVHDFRYMCHQHITSEQSYHGLCVLLDRGPNPLRPLQVIGHCLFWRARGSAETSLSATDHAALLRLSLVLDVLYQLTHHERWPSLASMQDTVFYVVSWSSGRHCREPAVAYQTEVLKKSRTPASLPKIESTGLTAVGFLPISIPSRRCVMVNCWGYFIRVFDTQPIQIEDMTHPTPASPKHCNGSLLKLRLDSSNEWRLKMRKIKIHRQSHWISSRCGGKRSRRTKEKLNKRHIMNKITSKQSVR